MLGISIEWWILYLLILGTATVAFLLFCTAVDSVSEDMHKRAFRVEQVLSRIEQIMIRGIAREEAIAEKGANNDRVRFGSIPVERKMITRKQLAAAMQIQVSDDIQQKPHRLVGEILQDLGYLNKSQVAEVLKEIAAVSC
jgi:hypothetical protein